MDHSEVKHLPKVDHTPAHLDNVSRLLLKAADVMEKRGKCEGIRTGPLGSVCVLGALDHAGGWADGPEMYGDHHPLWKKAVTRLALALGGTDCRDCVEWNNDAERSGDEIISKLRAVALGL
jgi:hypothetical protein